MKRISGMVAAAAMLVVPSIVHARAHIQIHAGIDSLSVDGASDEGFAYGAATGYDVPIGEALFVGVEVGIDGSTAASTAIRAIELIPGIQVSMRTPAEMRRDIPGVVRAGARLGARSRLHILGGYTNARVKVGREIEIIPGVRQGSSQTENLDGVRLGAGLERDIGPNFYGRLEYRYSNYERDVTRHNGLVGLGIRF